MIQHQFTITINTPDDITKAEAIDMFCEAEFYNGQGTKAEFANKKIAGYIIQKIKTYLESQKINTAHQELLTETVDYQA